MGIWEWAWIVLSIVVFGLIWQRRLWRLPDPDDDAPPVGAGLAVLALMWLSPPVMATLVGRQVAPGVEQLADMTWTQMATVMAAAYAAQGIWALVWVRQIAPRTHRAGMPMSAVLGVTALVAWWPVVQVAHLAGVAVVAGLGGEHEAVAHDLLREITEARFSIGTWVVVGLVTIAAPVMEEVMYRGALQSLLRRYVGRWGAIMTTSLVFMAAHWGGVSPQAMSALFVLSIGFGWVYERTGRLAAPICMHIAFNVANLLIAVA